MSSSAVVIGGGFAGLRVAVSLADAGWRVTVVEARNSLGGRARSFTDPATGEVVDNGQHLFLAGYHATVRFLERLGTERHLVFQRRLQVTFVERGGKVSTLDCPPLPAPWHLIVGAARLSNLSLRDKLALQRVSHAVNAAAPDPSLDSETVEGWLARLGQSSRSRELFWNPLTIATLNEEPSRASAFGLVAVLRTLMKGSWPDARLGMASVGLSDLYAESARRVLEQKGGEVLLNSPVVALEVDGSRIEGIRLASGKGLTADAVISALPPSVLRRLLSGSVCAPLVESLGRFSTAPIVSINLWLDRPITSARFVGLIGTRVQWLFNKPRYLALIISAAYRFLDLSNEALVEVAMEDLRACFPNPMSQARLIRSQVVREREATVSLRTGMERYRPGPRTELGNFFLAGDWTATGLPATIESAVVSGENCARAVLAGDAARVRRRA